VTDLLALLPPGVDAGLYLGMAVTVFLGACLQGIGGVGFAMFSAPLAALLFPALVPGPLLALGCPLALMTCIREFRAIEWPTAAAALVGRVIGTGLAGLILTLLSAQVLSVLFALLILTGVALSLAGWRVAATRTRIGIAGLASGVMGTITSAGAPPFAIAMQHMPPDRLRATLGCVFFVGSALSLLMLAAVGRFDGSHLYLSVLLLPWIVLGFWASSPLNRRFSRKAVRALLLGLATAGALGVLFRTWITP